MATTVKSLTMPNGAEYDFIGKTWYGTCSTSGSAQTKNAIISGFTSADREVGTRVIVRFVYAQSYYGTPKLSINGTVAANISSGNVTAGLYEWSSDSVVAFVYDGNYWVIEDGGHATTTYWGKTKLSSSVDDGGAGVAMTPYGTKNAVGSVYTYQYSNEKNDASNYIEYLNTTTPTTWTDGSVSYSNIDLSIISTNTSANRVVKITYNNMIIYASLPWMEVNEQYIIQHYLDGGTVEVALDVSNSIISINASLSLQGAYPFKVEYYYYTTAGFVSYPIFKDTVGDIETLLASI